MSKRYSELKGCLWLLCFGPLFLFAMFTGACGKALKVAYWNLHPNPTRLHARFPTCKILDTWTGVRYIINEPQNP